MRLNRQRSQEKKMSSNSSNKGSRQSKQLSNNGQRLVLGGITAVVLFVIVLIAQLAGVDVLHNQPGTSVPSAAIVPTDTPYPGGQPTPVVVEPTPIAAVPTSASSGTGNTTTGGLTAIPGGYDGGWFQLYFTQPINTQDESKFVGAPLENALVQALNRAQQTIDAALYQLNSQPVTDALIQAWQRGVKVRVVTDGEYGLNAPDSTVDQLQSAGIPVVSDGTRSGYMHDKFYVIDGLYVWTGSTNATHNDIYNNNNNSILIRSSQLAADYTSVFNLLFNSQFTTVPPSAIPNPAVTVNGTQIEVFFSPGTSAPARLGDLLSKAQTVRFLAFSFTEGLTWSDNGRQQSIMDLLINRASAGQLDLQGIVEASSRSFAKPMVCAGLNVRQDGNPDILHDKVFVIDNSIVVTGSFNFSKNAVADNNENVLIIHNPDIAQAYLNEFGQLWAQAKTITASGC
jgi:phosphatidylserine/phosphatidylglycerophosphate/cardiolipin synthase-like enzyme